MLATRVRLIDDVARTLTFVFQRSSPQVLLCGSIDDDRAVPGGNVQPLQCHRGKNLEEVKACLDVSGGGGVSINSGFVPLVVFGVFNGLVSLVCLRRSNVHGDGGACETRQAGSSSVVLWEKYVYLLRITIVLPCLLIRNDCLSKFGIDENADKGGKEVAP